MKSFGILCTWAFMNMGVLVAQDSLSATQVTYLGIHTTKLSSVMSHQLDLPVGLHLSVVRVGEESPAEKAGLQTFDVLLKFDDQILINQDQLKQLVRTREPEEQITLSLLRRGENKTIRVTLESTTLAMEEPVGSHLNRLRKRLFPNGMLFDDFGQDGIMGDFFGREFNFRPFSTMPTPSQILPPGLENEPSDDPLHRSEPDIQSFSYASTQTQRVFSDEKGTLELTEKDGMKFLRASDENGALLFEGPINSREERSKVPEDLLVRLENMEEKIP